MVIAFKSLLRLSKENEDKLKVVEKGSEEEDFLWYVQELIEELKAYMYSYDWLYKGKTKNKIRFFIESGCDYEVFMAEFNLTSGQARNTVCWANKQFKSKIGENTLTLLKQGYLDEARAAFYASSGQRTLKDFMISDCYEKMPEAKFDIYKLSECETELRVMRIMSKANLRAYFRDIDKSRLAYLRFLLEGHSKKAELFRPYIVKLLMNEISVDELLAMEEEIEKQVIY